MITSESVGAVRQSMPKVTIIQRVVPHYRVPFFKLLNERLAALGVAFNLVYGQEYSGTVPISTPIEAPWAVKICNCYIPGPGGKFVWQPAWSHAKSSDLIIVEQASAYLLNYWLLLYRRFGGAKVAYWGQGVNVRAQNPNSFPERVKTLLLKGVDWWFAYSEHTHQILRKAGYPENRITLVQNAVDNEVFKFAIEAVTPREDASLREALGITGSKVGLYCGAFIPPKRMGMVLEACVAIRRQVPDFEAIIIGSGPDQSLVETAAASNPWLHYVGPKFGAERASYFRISDVLIQPGTIGLVIIDSFVAEVPLFTTHLSAHGPEIAFVENGANGCVTPDSLDAYVDAVCIFLGSTTQRQTLIEGCRRSAPKYSMDAMVTNMVSGIRACLESRS